MAQLVVTGIGETLLPVSIAADYSGTPGTDPVIDTVKLQGREQLKFTNDHATQDFGIRIVGVGRDNFGYKIPYPFYTEGNLISFDIQDGSGSGVFSVPMLVVPANGGELIIGPFDPYRFIDASGLATIQYSLDDANLDPSTYASDFKVSAYRIFTLPT
jgi:hypothetical protein